MLSDWLIALHGPSSGHSLSEMAGMIVVTRVRSRHFERVVQEAFKEFAKFSSNQQHQDHLGVDSESFFVRM